MRQARVDLPANADFVIIGAGVAGVCELLRLMDRISSSYSIVLLEAGETLFPERGTSANQCGKLHLGLHYAGCVKTALRCLQDSVMLARMFPDCILHADDLGHPTRRGRHYVMSGSDFSPAEVRVVASALRDEYARLICIDPDNQVFGELDNFIVELDDGSYPEVAKVIPQPDKLCAVDEHVVLAYETAESQIDLEALRHRILMRVVLERISVGRDVRIFFGRKVLRIDREGLFHLGFSLAVECMESNERASLGTHVVVNCAWREAAQLDRSPDFARNQLYRAKVSLLVQLPEFRGAQNLNTCIFSVGPYCSITNLGNGTAILTYEPVTNIGEYRPGQDPALQQSQLGRLLRANGNHSAIVNNLKAGIRLGVERYIPAIAGFRILELRLGYVLQFVGSDQVNNIYAGRSSAHHSRLDSGVFMSVLGLVDVLALKMTYCAVLSDEAAVLAKYAYYRLRDRKFRKEIVVIPQVVLAISFMFSLFGLGFKVFTPSLYFARSVFQESALLAMLGIFLQVGCYYALKRLAYQGRLVKPIMIVITMFVLRNLFGRVLTDDFTQFRLEDLSESSYPTCGLEERGSALSQVGLFLSQGWDVVITTCIVYEITSAIFENMQDAARREEMGFKAYANQLLSFLKKGICLSLFSFIAKEWLDVFSQFINDQSFPGLIVSVLCIPVLFNLIQHLFHELRCSNFRSMLIISTKMLLHTVSLQLYQTSVAYPLSKERASDVGIFEKVCDLDVRHLSLVVPCLILLR